jgi:NodT family efflux transporter outer membrane factor (OMF) lipoprotein
MGYKLPRAFGLMTGILMAGTVAGCNLAPDYHRPQIATPAAFKESGDWKVAAPDEGAPRGPWWSIYKNPELDGLEDRVTQANQSLKAAVAQFQEAQAVAREARSSYFPTVNLNGAATRNKLSGTIANVRPQSLYNDYQANLNLSYEIDVWGRVRNLVEAGKDRAQASAGDLAAMDLSLHAELAIDYFMLRGDDAAQDIFDQTVRDYEKALELTTNRFNGGFAAQADVAEAQTQLLVAKTQDTNNHLLRVQLEHAIAILVGEPPANFSLEPKALSAAPPAIDAGFPGTLLERRPDIAAAERRVAAANADIGVQRAAYYPSFNLSAMFGVESAFPGQMLMAPAETWALGPSGVLSLFDGGLRDAMNDEARAAYSEMAADYRQTVLNAYGEVEDNLAALGMLEKEYATQKDAVAAAAIATTQAERRYAGGLNSYFEVVTAQNAELSARLALEDIQIRRMSASVSLIKALGGGWKADSGLDLREAALHCCSQELVR